jgi:hypothetical protein
MNTSATVPLTQQGVGQLPMSGSQQQVMQVISTDPAVLRQLADEGKI